MKRTGMIAFVRTVIIIAAAGMITGGIFRGEMSLIWNKAVMLCFECIGLG